MPFYRYVNDHFEFYKEALAVMPNLERAINSKKYGEKFVKWLIAVYSARSPYNRTIDTEEQVMEKVNQDFFSKKKAPWQNDPDIEKAIEEIEYALWDVDLVQLRKIDKAIRDESDKLEDAVTTDQLKEHAAALKSLNELRATVTENLSGKIKSRALDDINVKGGKRLSWLMKKQEQRKSAEVGTR